MKVYNGDSYELCNKIQFGTECILVTDPPFNIGYHYNTYKDKIDEDEYMIKLSSLMRKFEKCVIIHYPEKLHNLSYEADMMPERVVSWVYNSNTLRQHRDIAFYNICPNFKSVRQPYKNLNDKRIKKLIESGSKGAKLYDWWNVNQVKNTSTEKTEHPCQMPIDVMKNIIALLPDNVTIVDPFMGSGTTGVAVQMLNNDGSNRDFIGIEIDKKYFEIAKERLSL